MNNEIREQLIKHRARFGTTYAHIARQVSLSRNSISMFANDNRDLSMPVLNKIKIFLDMF